MDETEAWGVVLEEPGSRLGFELIHGESLVACATFALAAAGVTVVDARLDWEVVAEAGLPLVVHDLACPMTPADFIAHCVALAADGEVVVGVRPVTDTVKHVETGVLGETLDRDRLRALCAPVVIPADVVGRLDGWPTDLASLVARLAGLVGVRLEEGPPEIRRVTSAEDVRVLEALTAP